MNRAARRLARKATVDILSSVEELSRTLLLEAVRDLARPRRPPMPAQRREGAIARERRFVRRKL